MGFLRKSLVATFASLLTLVLIGFALVVGALHTLDKPANVKQALSASGVYKSLVPNALKQTGSISTSVGSIPLNDPQIAAAAEKSLPTSEVQNNANQVIDSIYAWLNGKTNTPDFSISLSGPKGSLASNVSGIVAERAASLPTCTSLSAIAQASSDFYNASCLPPGVTASQVAAEVKGQINGQQDFLGQNDITASSVKGSDNSKSVFTGQLAGLPKDYQRLKKLPYALALAAILLTIGVVALSSSRGRGLRRVGFSLVAAGVVSLVLGFMFNEIINQLVAPQVSIANAVAQSDIRQVITDLAHAIDKNYLVIGLIYLVLALAFIFSENVFTFASGRLNRRPETGVASGKASTNLNAPVDINERR